MSDGPLIAVVDDDRSIRDRLPGCQIVRDALNDEDRALIAQYPGSVIYRVKHG